MKISLIAVTLGTALAVAADQSVSIDLTKPELWSSYPVDAQKIQPVNRTYQGSGAAEFKLLQTAGNVSLALPQIPGETLDSFAFAIRKSDDCVDESLEVMITDADGEIFFTLIKLVPEWKNYQFKLNALRQYTYGGAKIADGRLTAPSNLRFNAYPAGRSFELANLTFGYVEPDATGKIKDKLDLATEEGLKKWFGWPGEAVKAQTGSEANSMRVDMTAKPGHLSFEVPPRAGFLLEGITFQAKRESNSTLDNIEFMVIEADGEIFYQQFKLTDSWQTFGLETEQLPQFTYGNAKIADGKLDRSRIRTLRLNGFPNQRSFQIKDITLLWSPDPTAAGQKAALPYQIVPIAFPSDTPVKRRYDGIGDIKIAGSNFVKNGKPYFVVGGWQLDQEGPPWLFRTLNIDVMVYNADEIYTLYAPQKNADGTYQVKWEPNPWYESIMQRYLGNKVNFWHEQKAGPEFSVLKKYQEFADVRNGGHFVAYDPYHPDGEAFYREMFKSWMQYTRKYPVFCYELFNEMVYDNPHDISRKAFAAAMKQHYNNDIDKANRDWKTDFKSFDAVDAPGYLSDGGKNPDLPRETLQLRESLAYPNLWIDWQKFQEQRCYDAVKRLMPVMRSYDPDPTVYSTLQSHMNYNWDYGDIGIKPETVHDFSNFYSHELGGIYIESGDYKSFDYIFEMIRPLFVHDLVYSISPDIPVFNAESPVGVVNRGAAESDLLDSDLADMHAGWKFYDATENLPADWMSPELDDRGWAPVKVPAMWADSGFRLCQLGIYRKHFTLAAPRGRLYFNGKGFADNAEIYLNGEKIGEVAGFDKKFTFDLTGKVKKDNLLAVKIGNRYFNNGMYYGGIRGFASVNQAPLMSDRNITLNDKHLRSFFWNQAVHHIDGVMLSYEGNLFTPAAKTIPRIKAEINSVGPIIMEPGNLLPAQTAIIYPLETLRGARHRDYLEKLASPANMYLMNYYAPLLFSGAGVDVLRNVDTEKSLSAYRLIVIPSDLRVPRGTLENLRKYVQNGGNLVISYNSFSTNDDNHQPLSAQMLTGNRETPDSTPASFQKIALNKRFIDGATRSRLTVESAKVLAAFDDGLPAITVNPLGRGRVYEFAGNFTAGQHWEWLDKIMSEVKITPYLTLNGADHAAMEGKIYRINGSGILIYLHNWEQSREVLLQLTTLPDGDKFTVRNTATGNAIAAPDGGALWSKAQLQGGLALRVNQFDPVVLLIEDAQKPAVKLSGISPGRLAILNQLWESPREYPKGPTAGLTANLGGTSGDVYGVIPTARKLLNEEGINVVNYRPGDRLDQLKLLIIQQPLLKLNNSEEILQYVKNGGSLLILGGAPMTYHSLQRNGELLKALNLTEGVLRTGVLYDDSADDKMRVTVTDVADHPAVKFVKTAITAGSNVLTAYPDNAEVLLRAPQNSNHPGKALMVAFDYGKGKVVYIADHYMFRPLHINDADNAQLWSSMVNYLLAQPARQLTPELKAKALYLSEESLRAAEDAEKAGQSTFTAPDTRSSYLKTHRSEDLSGLAGGDPIVNMLK